MDFNWEFRFVGIKLCKPTEKYNITILHGEEDPNLVGALSGHKEGSRAFARYRVTDDVAEANAKEIDEDMKRDLVSMLE